MGELERIDNLKRNAKNNIAKAIDDLFVLEIESVKQRGKLPREAKHNLLNFLANRCADTILGRR